MIPEKKHVRVLTIAGSDSGGGAGIQADLKTFSALGCYGMSVITALTAQNTHEVRGVYPVPPDFILQQIQAVVDDIGVDAIKVGMLYDIDIIQVVSDALRVLSIPIVLDPVMVSKSGNALLKQDAVEALKMHLFPIVTLATPNLYETEWLLHQEIKSRFGMEEAAKMLCEDVLSSVLVKGGHLVGGESPDCLYMKKQNQFFWFESNRIETKNTHGTGCTYSSAITAYLAKGLDLLSAVQEAKQYITSAIDAGKNYQLGSGSGPVQHFYAINERNV